VANVAQNLAGPGVHILDREKHEMYKTKGKTFINYTYFEI